MNLFAASNLSINSLVLANAAQSMSGLDVSTLITASAERNLAAYEELVNRAHRSPEIFATRHVDELLSASPPSDTDEAAFAWEQSFALYCLLSGDDEIFQERHLTAAIELAGKSAYASRFLHALGDQRRDLRSHIPNPFPTPNPNQRDILSLPGREAFTQRYQSKMSILSDRATDAVMRLLDRGLNVLGLKSKLYDDQDLKQTLPILLEESHLIDILQNHHRDRAPLHPTHVDAISAIEAARDSRDIRVFGFGESHPKQRLDTATTLERYIEDIVPYLAKECGVTVFAYEGLHQNADPEIEAYMETGSIEKRGLLPIFTRTRSKRGPTTLHKFLDAIRALRHDGYDVTLRGIQDTELWLKAYLSSPFRLQNLFMVDSVHKITENSRRLIQEALGQGKRIALYNGLDHIDSYPNAVNLHASYTHKLLGDELEKDEYLPIALVTPDYWPVAQSFFPRFYLNLVNAPEQGVVLKRKGNAFSIIYPGTDRSDS